MAKKFTFFIGLRYLNARKQGFISIISFISYAGIAVGVWALVVVTSVMNGMHKDMRDKIIGSNAHVFAMPYDARAGMSNYSDKVKGIKALPHVASAAPYFIGQAMLKSGDKVEGILLWGVTPDSISQVNKLRENMVKGEADSIMKTLPGGEKGVLLGKDIISNIGAEMGDEVIVISPVFIKTPSGMMPKMSKMKIVGVFDTGMYDSNSSFAYVSIKTAQELFNKGDVITGIAVKTDSLENAGAVATEIHRKYKDIFARDWMSMNKNLFSALQIEKIAMFIILVLIVLVAAFNIASTLIMVVMRKTKDIGILKSMGAANGDIMNIFMVQGVTTGLIGSAIGFLLGLLTCWFMIIHPISLPGGGSVYYVDKLAVAVKWSEIWVIPIVSVIISFLAALYPAAHASGLDPVESIRYE